MGTVTPIPKEQTGLFHSNQIAAFDYSERQAAFAARIMNCVSRAFYAISASPATQETVFWNLYVTKNIERTEIINKPADFIEGVRAIFGEAGTVVFEYMLAREIKREFGPSAAFDKKPVRSKNFADLLQLVA